MSSKTDVGLMVGSRPHVRRERNRMVRIGTGQDRTLIGRRSRCERGKVIMQSLFLKQFDFVVQCRDIRLQRHHDTELKNDRKLEHSIVAYMLKVGSAWTDITRLC